MVKLSLPRSIAALLKPFTATIVVACLVATSSPLVEGIGPWTLAKVGFAGLPQLELALPSQFGKITDYFNAPGAQSNGLVILVQDLHAHYSVQKNIAHILDFLESALNARQSGTRSVEPSPLTPFALAVEGAEGPVDTSVMALFPDASVRAETSDFLMREGEMTGMEFFAARHGLSHALMGVENKRFYEANRNLFRQTLPERLGAVRELKGIQEGIRTRIARALNEPSEESAAAVQSQVGLYTRGQIDLQAFVGALVQQSTRGDLSAFPMVATYNESSALALNPGRLRLLADAFLSKVGSRLSGAEAAILERLAREDAMRSYYLYLRDLIYEHQLFIAVPAELGKDLEFIHSTEGSGIDLITFQAKALALRLELKNARDPLLRELLQAEHDLSVAIQLLDLQATEYEVKTLVARSDSLIDRVSSLATAHSLAARSRADLRNIILKCIDYYRLASSRNLPMVDRTLALMNRAGSKHLPSTAVLVAGGYHTEAITQLLRERNVSYMVITPFVESLAPAQRDLYIRRLNGQFLADSEVYAAALKRDSLLSKSDQRSPSLSSIADLAVGYSPQTGMHALLFALARSRKRLPGIEPTLDQIYKTHPDALKELIQARKTVSRLNEPSSTSRLASALANQATAFLAALGGTFLRFFYGGLKFLSPAGRFKTKMSYRYSLLGSWNSDRRTFWLQECAVPELQAIFFATERLALWFENGHGPIAGDKDGELRKARLNGATWIHTAGYSAFWSAFDVIEARIPGFERPEAITLRFVVGHLPAFGFAVKTAYQVACREHRTYNRKHRLDGATLSDSNGRRSTEPQRPFPSVPVDKKKSQLEVLRPGVPIPRKNDTDYLLTANELHNLVANLSARGLFPYRNGDAMERLLGTAEREVLHGLSQPSPSHWDERFKLLVLFEKLLQELSKPYGDWRVMFVDGAGTAWVIHSVHRKDPVRIEVRFFQGKNRAKLRFYFYVADQTATSTDFWKALGNARLEWSDYPIAMSITNDPASHEWENAVHCDISDPGTGDTFGTTWLHNKPLGYVVSNRVADPHQFFADFVETFGAWKVLLGGFERRSPLLEESRFYHEELDQAVRERNVHLEGESTKRQSVPIQYVQSPLLSNSALKAVVNALSERGVILTDKAYLLEHALERAEELTRGVAAVGNIAIGQRRQTVVSLVQALLKELVVGEGKWQVTSHDKKENLWILNTFLADTECRVEVYFSTSEDRARLRMDFFQHSPRSSSAMSWQSLGGMRIEASARFGVSLLFADPLSLEYPWGMVWMAYGDFEKAISPTPNNPAAALSAFKKSVGAWQKLFKTLPQSPAASRNSEISLTQLLIRRFADQDGTPKAPGSMAYWISRARGEDPATAREKGIAALTWEISILVFLSTYGVLSHMPIFAWLPVVFGLAHAIPIALAAKKERGSITWRTYLETFRTVMAYSIPPILLSVKAFGLERVDTMAVVKVLGVLAVLVASWWHRRWDVRFFTRLGTPRTPEATPSENNMSSVTHPAVKPAEIGAYPLDLAPFVENQIEANSKKGPMKRRLYRYDISVWEIQGVSAFDQGQSAYIDPVAGAVFIAEGAGGVVDLEVERLKRFQAAAASAMPESGPWASLEREERVARVEAFWTSLAQMTPAERQSFFEGIGNQASAAVRMGSALTHAHQISIQAMTILASLSHHAIRIMKTPLIRNEASGSEGPLTFSEALQWLEQNPTRLATFRFSAEPLFSEPTPELDPQAASAVMHLRLALQTLTTIHLVEVNPDVWNNASSAPLHTIMKEIQQFVDIFKALKFQGISPLALAADPTKEEARYIAHWLANVIMDDLLNAQTLIFQGLKKPALDSLARALRNAGMAQSSGRNLSANQRFQVTDGAARAQSMVDNLRFSWDSLPEDSASPYISQVHPQAFRALRNLFSKRLPSSFAVTGYWEQEEILDGLSASPSLWVVAEPSLEYPWSMRLRVVLSNTPYDCNGLWLSLRDETRNIETAQPLIRRGSYYEALFHGLEPGRYGLTVANRITPFGVSKGPGTPLGEANGAPRPRNSDQAHPGITFSGAHRSDERVRPRLVGNLWDNLLSGWHLCISTLFNKLRSAFATLSVVTVVAVFLGPLAKPTVSSFGLRQSA